MQMAMRTTLDIDDDVLLASKESARRQGRSAGAVLSDLARMGLRAQLAQGDQPEPFFGFQPIAGVHPVTNADVNRLREELGE